MRSWWRWIRTLMLAGLGYLFMRLIGLTLRVRVVGEEKLQAWDKGKIVAGWHGRTFLAALCFRHRGWWALISRSRDGEIQNRLFRWLGFRTVRGSTGRGGVRAAAECVTLLKKGETFVYTPDGPRGPSQKVQRGILWLAQKAGAAIFPAGASARPRKLLPTWDRYLLPLPFGKGIIVIGDPLFLPEGVEEQALEAWEKELEKRLNDLQRQAEREMGYSD
jgi:lysophospholipid acyltransferase (LPLAT)-like uncharacterized protein